MEMILIAAETLIGTATGPKNGNGFDLPIAVCAAILFLSVWLMLRGRNRRARNRQSSISTSTSTSSMSSTSSSAVEESHAEHAAEVYEIVRELTGKLDTKFRLLNTLIQDADRAADRLETAQRREATPTKINDAHASDAHANTDPVSDTFVNTSRPDGSPELSIDKIYLYADYGFSASDTASRLKVPTELVERILRERV